VFWKNYFAHIHVIFKSLGAGGWTTPPEPEPPVKQPAVEQQHQHQHQQSSDTNNTTTTSTSTSQTKSSDYVLPKSPSEGAGVGSSDLSPEELALLEEVSSDGIHWS